MRVFFSSLLSFLAGAAIGIWVWSYAHRAIVQKHDEQTFMRERKAAPAQPPSAPPARPPKTNHGDVVARLLIQKIHLHAMVREGSDHSTLEVALGHIPGTAMPGQKGNVCVAGHRDTIFRRLAEVGRNDQIQLQTPSTTYTYQVDDLQIVTPKTVSVLLPGQGSHLTLVTCYPFNYIGSAPKRYIVKAHLVSHNATAPETVPAVTAGTHD
jgi:sortase A